jgi:hypothetical protein
LDWAANVSLLLTSFARQGVRAGPPEPPPPGVIDAAIQRFDGGSGAAFFRGTIPFAPGVVTTSADLDSVVVLVNGSEPAGGLFIELVEGYHSDDSRKAARIEFEATVNDANPVLCTVNLSGVRTVADRTTAQDTVEFTTRAWQLAPTLFGITDAAYLCNSRIAPMPLIPDDDPRIPAPLLTYATTFYDTLEAGVVGGGAEYDEAYACHCRYLTSGDLAYLEQATTRCAADGRFSYYVPNPDFPYDTVSYPNANAIAPVNLNPVEYATTNGSGNGIPSEPFDYSLSYLLCYWLTGWEYGRLIVEKNSAHKNTDYGWSLGTSAETLGAEVRNTVRRYLLQGIAASGLHPLREIDMKGGLVYRSGTQAWGAEAASKTLDERAQRMMARHQLYRDTVLSVPAWLPKMIGFNTDAANDQNGYAQPNFQFEFAWVFVMAYLNGTITDTDMLDEAEHYGAWVASQISPLRTATNYHESTLRTMPYLITPPATVADGTGTGDQSTTSGVYPLMTLHVLALHYALTGDTDSRDLFDEIAANYSKQMFEFTTPGLAPGAISPEGATSKLFGQVMHTLRHGIAWRVNGFVGWGAP